MKRRYWRAAWTFLPYLRRYKRLAAGSVVLLVAGALADLATPWPFALLIGYVLVGKLPPGPVTTVFGVNTDVLIVAAVSGGFLLVLLVHGIAVISEWVNTKLDLSIALDFRTRLFAHCLELSDCFTDEAAPGDFMYRINYEARSVGAMAVAVPPLAQSLITLVGYFVIALTLDPALAFLALTVVPFIYYSTGYYAKRIEPRLVTTRGLEGLSLTMVNTAMSMIHVITSFNRQHDEHVRFRRQGERARDMRVGVTVRQTVFSMAVALITAAGTAAILYVGAHHVLSGRTSITALLVLMAYIASMYKPLEAFAHTLSQLQVYCVSIMFSRQLLERRPLVTENSNAGTLTRAAGHIRYQGVGFDYPGRPGILEDINFEIQPGELVAVVGPTGAGKSTLLQLLPRFFDPGTGSVELDGHDLRDVTLASLREQIALVRQEPLLFPRSIAENIAYARPGATQAEVEAAARAANAHEFIAALPDGYETVLGERGARISGGERQRLALARAFLKDAPILVLDEPTSSIDTRTEAVILEALERLTAGRTTIIAAHRLSTVRAATRVLVLDHGRLVENGLPADLLAHDGLFATLSRLQRFDATNSTVSTNGAGTLHFEKPPDKGGAPQAVPVLKPNAVIKIADRARATRGTGALHLKHRDGQCSIFSESGELHSAHGDLGAGDELVITAMTWRDLDFTWTVDPDATLPATRNITMQYEDLVAEAARRRALLRQQPADKPASIGTQSTRPSIVLLGSMSAMPVGGVIWQNLHYIVGFQRLGYDVYYVETHGRYPRTMKQRPGQDATASVVELISSVMAGGNMAGRWCYVAQHDADRHYGMTPQELELRYREASAIINLHGGTIPRPEHTRGGRLVYLETDPVPMQVSVAAHNQADIDFLAMHDAFFSYGENYGAADCRVPQSERFHFLPTRQPVVLEYWPFTGQTSRTFTTVGNWNQYQDVTLDGETYTWSKRVEFLKFLDLPRLTSQKFELALSQCGPEDVALLREHGWQARDALEFSHDAAAYREFITSSRAEFTVAKDQNVRLRSGWFSDRSATYLAAGRPVVTQDTAFGNIFPTGAGLFSFKTMDEAVDAIQLIDADYGRQRAAARRIAEEWFDSDVVLGRLLRDLGLPVPARGIAMNAGR